MKVINKCPHCDCALEFVNDTGEHMVFTAHDDAYCVRGTRRRLHVFEDALLSLQESYERSIARCFHEVDAALARRGLPSLGELVGVSDDVRALANLELYRSNFVK